MSKPIKLEYVASEGSTVVFDALEFTIDKRAGYTKSSDENKVKFESCYQKRVDSIQINNLAKELDDRIYSFKAPYLRDENAVTTILNFRLKIVCEDTGMSPILDKLRLHCITSAWTLLN